MLLRWELAPSRAHRVRGHSCECRAAAVHDTQHLSYSAYARCDLLAKRLDQIASGEVDSHEATSLRPDPLLQGGETIG